MDTRKILLCAIGLASSLIVGCGSTWAAGRSVAARTLGCPEDRLDVLVPHSYNLGAGEHVYRGCGASVVVHCATTTTTTLCRPVSDVIAGR